MNDPRLRPPGLSVPQLQRLDEHVHRGQLVAADQLLQSAYQHLDELREVNMVSGSVDLAIAEAIVHRMDRVIAEWDAFSPPEQSLLRGAIRYFSKSQDDIPDTQPRGLDDDLEVFNACLTAVRRPDLLLG